jgi:predicted enzyme related to lactoylglutathione lyase
MPNPVVHFEIQSSNPEALHEYYRELFGWHVSADNPMNYGLVDTHTDKGIGGGIGGKQEGAPNPVTFYVESDDLQPSLDKAVELGGTVVMPVTEIPNMVTFALFADPEGNVVGVVKNDQE